MEKFTLKDSPGVFSGFSTTKRFPGVWVTYLDGDELIARIPLHKTYPESHTSHGTHPGYEVFIFFKHSLVMKCPKDACKYIKTVYM